MRQAIGLAQPMKIFCKPDCKGLCSVCHKNRNLADCGHAQGGAESSTRPRLTPRPNKG
ncbi:MAG: YceD family protein [Elusimicrobiota bacterium]